MNYAVILFDLDGTMADTAIGITKSIRFALAKFGISEESDETLTSFIGAPLLPFFKEHYSLSEDDARRALDFYRERYAETGILETSIYPGIPSLLRELKGAGKRLIVATLKPAVYAERILSHFRLRDNFDHVFGPALGDGEPTKTEIIKRALTEASNTPRDAILMVGDRVHDVAGARTNGIDSVAVTYGYGAMDELQQADPTYIVNSVEELRALLDSSP